MAKKMPTGWRKGFDDTVACPHRDMSVCRECTVRYEENLLEVYGVHYWASAEEKAAHAELVEELLIEVAG